MIGRAARCFEQVLGVERGTQSGQLAQIAAQAAYANFRDSLKSVAARIGSATDRAMLTSVHQNLTDLFQNWQARDLPALLASVRDLGEEIAAHRERQRALLAVALSTEQMSGLADRLLGLGLIDVTLGEQSDGPDLIGHVIEARRT